VEEHFRPFRISKVSLKASSVLELPPHTIYRTGTQVGDAPTRLYAQEGEQFDRFATGVERAIFRAAVCRRDDSVRKRHRILTQRVFRDAGGCQKHG